MDTGTMNVFANLSNRTKYISLSLIISLSVLAYCWLWSFLVNLFDPIQALLKPWLAPLMALHYAYNHPKTNLLLLITFSLPICLIGAAIVISANHRRSMTLYGDAHWATYTEVKKMGLLNNAVGLVIGDAYSHLLRAPLVSHALVFAPSRSGKGVSQVIPNALTFQDSMLIVDMKLEIFEATSGFRAKHGQGVFLFAPADRKGVTHCFNPLDLINRDPSRLIAEMQLCVEILVTDKKDEDSMWIKEARSLALGLLLWIMESDKPFTIGTLAAIVKGTPDFVGFLTQIINEAVNEHNQLTLHPIAFTNINNFVQKAPKEQSGVKSTLSSRLNLWDDPYINAATSHSDFDIREMRRNRMTVYLGIPANQLERLAPLMNLFIQLFINCLTENLPQVDEKYKVLVVLDEMVALGRMNKIKAGFGYFAGFNIHLMAIIQNIGQFFDVYGGRDKCDVFLQNTDYKIAYRQNTKTDRHFISDELGTKTVKIKSKSFNGLSTTLPNVSESLIGRPLLSPHEVGSFPKKKGIALISGEPPIRYKKIIYYKDKRFKARILPPIKINLIEPAYPQLELQQLLSETATRSDKIKEPEMFLQQMSELTTLAKQFNPILPKDFDKNLPAEIFENLEI